MPSSPDTILYYFSGTGNSWRLAERIAAEHGSATPRSIERGLHPDHDAAQHHAFFFPVYAFGLPPIMSRFLKSLPPAEGRSAFAVVALGDIKPPPYWLPGYEGSALYQARAILRRKGYHRISDLAAHMPENYVVVGNTPSPETAAAIRAAGETQVAEGWQRHLSGGVVRTRRFLLWRLLLTPIYWSWRLAGRRLTGKSFGADDRCNACEACARRCPVGAIAMEAGRPRWRWNCENCLRCLSACPQSAVQISWFLLLAFTVLFWPASLLARWLLVLPPMRLSALPYGIGVTLTLAVELSCYVALAVFFDNAIRQSLRWRVFRRLLALTYYTRRLRRYLAPGFPSNDLQGAGQGASYLPAEANRRD